MSEGETVTIAQNPALTVTKTATSTGPYNLNDTITYSIVAENTGNMTLTGVTITDPGVGAVLGTCTPTQPATLAPNATLTCAATHVVTQADIDAGSYANTAFADSSETDPVSEGETVTIAQNPALAVTKTATSTGPYDLNDTITYSIVAENTGNTTLTGVTITDPGVGAVLGTCTPTQPATLAPNATLTCAATHVVTQADIDAGSYANTAFADSSETDPVSEGETVTIAQNPALTVTKTATSTGPYNLNDTITYSIVAENTGNMTLTGVTITDPGVGAVLGTCTPTQPATLAPNATLTCAATHVVTQADIDAGSYANTAFADSSETDPVSEGETVTIAQNPALAVTKSNPRAGPYALNDTITYSIVAENTGNMTLTGVTITDPGVGAVLGTCTPTQPATLAPNATLTCAATHVVTQADIDAGSYANTATASSDQTQPVTDDETVSTAQNPQVGLAKQAASVVEVSTGTYDIRYNFVVRNYGNVALSNLQVSDNLALTFPPPASFTVRSLTSLDFSIDPTYDGSGNNNLLLGTDTLAIGGSGTITLVVRVVPTNSGPYNNSAVATGNEPDDDPVTDISQNGNNPDSDSDGDPTDNNDPTPVTFEGNLLEPPIGFKEVNDQNAPVLKWTVTWINNANIVAVLAEAADPIPAGTTFRAVGPLNGYPLPVSAPTGSTTAGVTCTNSSTVTTTTYCYYEGPTATYPRGRIVWVGTLGPDLGAENAAEAQHEIVITFSVTAASGVTSVKNTATIDFDKNGDGDVTDPGERRVATTTETWKTSIPETLPDTGFAPGRVTTLPAQPPHLAYQALGSLWLELPTLGVQSTITGIPNQDGKWDISWLGSDAGWLTGTAYPTTYGNSAITAHVYLANGKPGPFVNLRSLKWGDQVVVHSGGQRYVYEVRQVEQVKPGDLSTLRHEDLAWVTLITCQGYNEASNTYTHRTVVRAVLVKITSE